MVTDAMVALAYVGIGMAIGAVFGLLATWYWLRDMFRWQ